MTANNNNQAASGQLPDPKSLQRLAVSETGFVFDPVSGHSFTVNDTGREIMELIKEHGDIAGVVDALTQRYAGKPSDIERDIWEFIAVLRRYVQG